MPVKVIAGCIAATRAPTRAGRLEDGQAVPAGGVHDVAGPRGCAPLSASIVTTLASMSSGTASSSRSQALRDGGRLAARHAGEQLGDPPTRGVGLARGGDHVVAGGAECGAQDGADAACADDAHPHGVGHREPLSFPSLRPLARPVPGARAGVGTGLLMCSTTTVRGSFPAGHRVGT